MEQGNLHADGDLAAAAADSRAAGGEADAFLMDGTYDFGSAAFVHADYGETEEQQQQQDLQQKRYFGDSSYIGGAHEEQEGKRGGQYTAPPPMVTGANRTELSATGPATGSAGIAAGATKEQRVEMVNGYLNDVSSSLPSGLSSATESLYGGSSYSGLAGAVDAENGREGCKLNSHSSTEDDAVDAAARQAVEALRVQMQQEVEARRTGEAQQKKEQRELAQKELQDFYQKRKQQIERRRKANQLKESEEAKKEEVTQEASANSWGRVIQLIEDDDRSSTRSSSGATSGTTDKKTGVDSREATAGSASTAPGAAAGGGGPNSGLKERCKMKGLLLELSAQGQGKAC